MKQIWIITRRELKSFFDSLMAYVMIVLFLGFSRIQPDRVHLPAVLFSGYCKDCKGIFLDRLERDPE